MTKEEFIDKIKELNISVPDECFFLEYNKCVYDILEERDNYKERIEKAASLLEKGITFCKNDSGGVYDTCNIAIKREQEALNILRGDDSDR